MTSTDSSRTPILAIACGPIVTTWDIAQSTTSQHSNLFSAQALAGTGTGIEQFKPHGNNIVNDLAWNHNGQVIATCSNATSIQQPHNVVLTHYATRSKLESFSNFHNSSNDHTNGNTSASPIALGGGGGGGGGEATSISFGGKSAKSRYLCVSDTSGIASVWDMKKGSRVRSFKVKHPVYNVSSSSTTIGSNIGGQKHSILSGRPACVKSTMDPSDTHVVALHGSSPSFSINRIALELFHLKSGSRAGLLSTPDFHYGGGADCFECSLMDDGFLLVGSKDGSLLLWDYRRASGGGGMTGTGTGTATLKDIGPFSVLEKRHMSSITHVSYSPMNRVLAASCSMDGTVGFHDVGSKQTIQSIRPWDHVGKDGSVAETGKSKGLSSLAFHHDGFTWAVGTDTGIVFTYDLRQTGNGPLCTLVVSPSGDESIKKLQFVQSKGGVSQESAAAAGGGVMGSSIPKSSSSVKKKIDMDRDGVVTVEREKTTPSRKEVSKTTYTVTEEQPASTTGASSVSSFSHDPSSDTKTSSTSRREKVTTSRITTRKIVTSSPQRTASSVLSSPPPPEQQKVRERTSTSESETHTSSSPQRPGTTTRITKTKVSTSSSENPTTYDFTSPPPASVAKDLFANSPNEFTASQDKNKSTIHRNATSSKKDSSVSFDDRINRNIVPNDLSFDSNGKSEGSDKETEHMMEDFDAMYERIKKRALKNHTITSDDFMFDKDTVIDQEDDDDSGDGILPNTKATKLNENDGTGIQNQERRNANESLTLSDVQIQDMIDDAVESLRDDMEESMQALQLDFLKQMQKQTDEVNALLQEHRQEIVRLQMRNEYLEKENMRLSGQM